MNVWVKEFSVLWIDATPPTWLPGSWTQGGHTSCVCVVLKHHHSWFLCFCSSAASRTLTCLMSLKCCSRDFSKEFLCLFSLVMFHGWDWISGEGCTCPNVHLWQFPSYQCWRWWYASLYWPLKAFWSANQTKSQTATFLGVVCHLLLMNSFSPANWLHFLQSWSTSVWMAQKIKISRSPLGPVLPSRREFGLM